MSTAPTEPTLYISPALVILEKNKGSEKMSPQFSTTIFKGFTTSLTASIVRPGGAAQGEHTDWHWKVLGNGSESVTLSNQHKQVVEVTGIKPGVVTLQAQASLKCNDFNIPFTSTVEITIEETDLLIYAPDGYVYRVPHKVWANPHQQAVSPDEGVQVLTMNNVSGLIQSMLVNQVAVANVPEHPPGETMTTVTDPSDNITCFLLNLNSILLYPQPPTNSTLTPQSPKPWSPNDPKR